MEQMRSYSIAGKYHSGSASLTGNISAESIIHDNCIRVSTGANMIKTQSSPFVASVAGRLLRALPTCRQKTQILDGLRQYLMETIDEDGMIGFLDPCRHRYDLDTLACVHGFIWEMNSNDNQQLIDRLLKLFDSHKDPNTGAYYTWVDKPNNNVDFMVNMNIAFFFSLIGYEDKRLLQYLSGNAKEFLLNGSHYYHDLGFPLVMMLNYDRYFMPWSGENSFSAILNYIINHPLAVQALAKLRDRLKSCNAAIETPESPVIQCFNSRDAVYYAPLIDALTTKSFLFDLLSEEFLR